MEISGIPVCPNDGISPKTLPTASLGVVSLRDVDFGPLLAAFGGVLSMFVTHSPPKCARQSVLGKFFCISDAVGLVWETDPYGPKSLRG